MPFIQSSPSRHSNVADIRRKKCRVRSARNEVVLGDKLIEFRCGHCVVPPVNEFEKEEDVTLSVVEVDSAGGGLVRHRLQEQNASWHLDPPCRHGIANGEENLDDMLDAGILVQANIVSRKQRCETYCSSTLIHDRFLSVPSGLVVYGKDTPPASTANTISVHSRIAIVLRCAPVKPAAVFRFSQARCRSMQHSGAATRRGCGDERNRPACPEWNGVPSGRPRDDDQRQCLRIMRTLARSLQQQPTFPGDCDQDWDTLGTLRQPSDRTSKNVPPCQFSRTRQYRNPDQVKFGR